MPPKTWQQVLDISQFFNGKNWDSHDPDPDSGMVLHLKVGEQGHYHFQSLSASFVVNPGDKVDQTHNVYWFDPTNMKPLINSPGHVKALEFLSSSRRPARRPRSAGRSARPGTTSCAASRCSCSPGATSAACARTRSRSKIQGDCAAAMLPGSSEYYDMTKKQFVKSDTPQLVGNTTGGSWQGVISNFSANPEAVYSFLSLMAIEPVSKLMGYYGWDGVDPGNPYQFLKEQGGTADIQDYVKAGWYGERRQGLHPGLPRQLPQHRRC